MARIINPINYQTVIQHLSNIVPDDVIIIPSVTIADVPTIDCLLIQSAVVACTIVPPLMMAGDVVTVEKMYATLQQRIEAQATALTGYLHRPEIAAYIFGDPRILIPAVRPIVIIPDGDNTFDDSISCQQSDVPAMLEAIESVGFPIHAGEKQRLVHQLTYGAIEASDDDDALSPATESAENTDPARNPTTMAEETPPGNQPLPESTSTQMAAGETVPDEIMSSSQHKATPLLSEASAVATTPLSPSNLEIVVQTGEGTQITERDDDLKTESATAIVPLPQSNLETTGQRSEDERAVTCNDGLPAYHNVLPVEDTKTGPINNRADATVNALSSEALQDANGTPTLLPPEDGEQTNSRLLLFDFPGKVPLFEPPRPHINQIEHEELQPLFDKPFLRLPSGSYDTEQIEQTKSPLPVSSTQPSRKGLIQWFTSWADRFESRSRGIIERTPKLTYANRKIDQQLLARLLENEMENKLHALMDEYVANNCYVVYLSSVDFAHYRPIIKLGQQELATHLREVARARGYRFQGQLQVLVEENTELQAGEHEIKSMVDESVTLFLPQPMLEIERTGQQFFLQPQTTTLGRSTQCTIAFPSASRHNVLSRHHAEIRYEFGRYVLYDGDGQKSSKAGTYVNGQRLNNEGHPLNNGDTIMLGPPQRVETHRPKSGTILLLFRNETRG